MACGPTHFTGGCDGSVLPNDLSATLRLLAPYAEELAGIAVESTFNWYWLVDGLMAHDYAVSPVNTPVARKRYGV